MKTFPFARFPRTLFGPAERPKIHEIYRRWIVLLLAVHKATAQAVFQTHNARFPSLAYVSQQKQMDDLATPAGTLMVASLDLKPRLATVISFSYWQKYQLDNLHKDYL